MSNSRREPIEWIEIDLDYCALNFGNSPCTASLTAKTERKCFNTFHTCKDKENFNKPVEVTDITTPDHTHSAGTFSAPSSLDADLFWAIDVTFPSVSTDGIIWEVGGTGSGLYVGISGGDLVYRVGDGSTGDPDGAAVMRVHPDFLLGKTGTLYGNVDVSTGTINLFFWGTGSRLLTELGSAVSVTGFTYWSGSDGGGVGEPGGTTTAGDEDATSWSESVGDLRLFLNTFYTPVVGGRLTYKMVEPRSNYPKGDTTFPCLRSVTGRSSTVNIAGSDDRLYPLGRRGSVTAVFDDFPYHDSYPDKYQPERISGAAQFSGIGYNPKDFGTFWSRLRARNPNYANRPMRHCTGFMDGGVVVTDTVRHFIITEISRNTSTGKVTVTGKDVLKLADDDRAVAPKPNQGVLRSDQDEISTGVMYLDPPGIGSEYSESGFAVIGSEIVKFTRSGDAINVIERGVSGTTAKSHSKGDSFQETFSPRKTRIDYVIKDLLVNYANVDESFIPFDDWNAEASRWAPTMYLTADITKPTGVAKLIGELAVLGISIWWDEVDQEVKFLVNRPVLDEDIYALTDRNNIIESSLEDRDGDRLTEVIFNYVQIDPTKGNDEENYIRSTYLIDAETKLPMSYGDQRVKTINCRWINHGDRALARVLSIRMLNRFRVQPVRYYVEVDYRDNLSVAQVVGLESDVITSPTGIPEIQRAQVIKREDVKTGHRIGLTLQRFQFDKRYAYFTGNSRPVYTSSTDAEKEKGAYWVDSGEVFGDGGDAYRFA